MRSAARKRICFRRRRITMQLLGLKYSRSKHVPKKFMERIDEDSLNNLITGKVIKGDGYGKSWAFRQLVKQKYEALPPEGVCGECGFG